MPRKSSKPLRVFIGCLLFLLFTFQASVAAQTKLVFWTMWTSEVQIEVQRAWIEKFEAENPGIEVELVAVP